MCVFFLVVVVAVLSGVKVIMFYVKTCDLKDKVELYFLNSSSAFRSNSRFVLLFVVLKTTSHPQNFNVTFINRFRATIICWITDCFQFDNHIIMIK